MNDAQVVANQILLNREIRTLLLKRELFRTKKVVGILELNLPGENKNLLKAKNFFEFNQEKILKFLSLKQIKVSSFSLRDFAGGCCFLIFEDQISGKEIKKLFLGYEKWVNDYLNKKSGKQTTFFNYSSLIDLDVYELKNQEISKVSRIDLNDKKRQCFLCEKTAKECRREQNHSVKELLTYVEKLLDSFQKTNLLESQQKLGDENQVFETLMLINQNLFENFNKRKDDLNDLKIQDVEKQIYSLMVNNLDNINFVNNENWVLLKTFSWNLLWILGNEMPNKDQKSGLYCEVNKWFSKMNQNLFLSYFHKLLQTILNNDETELKKVNDSLLSYFMNIDKGDK